MIEWDGTDSVEMVIDAFPPPRLAVPSVVLPSVNVTVPDAAVGVTVAVKVTDELYVEGLAEEASVVEELVFPNAIPVRVTHRIKITAHWKKVRITIRTPRFELEQRRRPAQ